MRTALLLAVGACVAALAASRATVSYDLDSLLPTPYTTSQKILKERVGLGPGAQVIFSFLPGANSQTASAVAERLRQTASVRRVLPVADGMGVDAIPSVLWRSQFVLTDLPTDQEGWRRVLEDRLSDVAIADDDLTALIAADPMFATVGTLARLSGTALQYDHPDGQYLIISTTVPAFDAEGQYRLVGALRKAIREAGVTDARLYGNGVYTADLQAKVRFEATLFSLFAGCGLICLLLWRFRSWSVLGAIAAPMFAGTAAGFCALALAFDEIHGIGLAFGFTLLGVTVDYPLHVFSHPDRPQSVWPTLRISIASTLIAYGVFLFGGSSALSQLGVFAIVGVAGAALATRWLVQQLPPGTGQMTDRSTSGSAARKRLSHWPWVVGLVLSTPLVLFRPSFSDDLDKLTPVAPDILAADAEVRDRLGASDMRHLVAVQGESLELVLQRTEAVAMQLGGSVASGALAGFSHVAQLLPSHRSQERRHSALREFVADGGTRPGTAFAKAADELGYSPSAFRPFDERAAASSAALDLLSPDALRDDDLGAFVDTHLYAVDDIWKSLVFLRGIADIRMIETALEQVPAVELVDLKTASGSLVAEFRQRLLRVLGILLIVITGAVYLLTRDMRRTIWVVGTVVTALVVAASGTSYLHDGISPFDLMSLALVAGLGLDYGLFFSKEPCDRQDASDTADAVQICAISSLLVFAILSFSGIPVLSGIGSTVATGVLAAYVLARFGRSAQRGQ